MRLEIGRGGTLLLPAEALAHLGLEGGGKVTAELMQDGGVRLRKTDKPPVDPEPGQEHAAR
ncbi:MAG TPA: hypothetical protein VED40_06845 [Azospirillaceae bacterium]|nr:hypothetical protein [Azospirillaceae bacterium]